MERVWGCGDPAGRRSTTAENCLTSSDARLNLTQFQAGHAREALTQRRRRAGERKEERHRRDVTQKNASSQRRRSSQFLLPKRLMRIQYKLRRPIDGQLRPELLDD